jgi:regulator of sigma E protease
MALFSINLAVLNLLPIPVLDGGHLVFLGIEAVRGGRGLSLEQKLRWSNVGFLVVVGIMLWALSNDFLRLLGI